MGERLAGVLRAVHLLPLVVWLGGAVLLFVAVAPVAFEVLPTRTDAGSLVGRVIDRLDLLALFATPVLVLTAWHDERRQGNPTARWVRISALLGLGTAAAVSYLVLTPRIAALRKLPGFAAEGSSLRAEFQTLHGVSMTVMLFGVACALGALYFAVRQRSPLAEALRREAEEG